MALQVSEDAQEIDVLLRQRAVKDQKRFAHLEKLVEKRRHQPEAKPKAASGWQDKIAKMREIYPKAYMPWQHADDDLLKREFQNGATVAQLSKKLGRHEGSIKMRLQKHFGEDAVS
jgi:IS30 family transposase